MSMTVFKTDPFYLHIAHYLKEIAICSGIRNHSGHYQVRSFSPTMHLNNECTTERQAAREHQCTVSCQKMPSTALLVHLFVQIQSLIFIHYFKGLY